MPSTAHPRRNRISRPNHSEAAVSIQGFVGKFLCVKPKLGLEVIGASSCNRVGMVVVDGGIILVPC